jgi:hypothetical protein
MPIYAIEMSHASVSCPIFNADVGKKFKEGAAKREEAAKKYKVKVLASCVAVLEHWIFYLIEANSRSAVEDYLKETGWAFYNNVQIREVDTIEEATKRWIT